MSPAYRAHLVLSFVADLADVLIWTGFTVFQLSVVGMSPLQLVLVGSIFEITILLCEVPTGVIADLVSRRLSVIIGFGLTGMAYTLQALVPTFEMAVAGAVIWGVGVTCLSGAYDAWLADELGQEQLGPALLRGEQVARVAALFGLVGSAGLGSIALGLPVLVGGALFAACAVYCMIAMPERHFHRAAADERSTWRKLTVTLRDGVRVVRRRPALLRLLAVLFFFGLFSEAWDRLWQAHMLITFDLATLTQGMPLVALAALRGTEMLLSILGAELLRRRMQAGNQRQTNRLIFIFTAVMVVSLFGYGLAPHIAVAMLVFVSFSVARSLIGPLLNVWQNAQIDDSRVRATVLSLGGQSDALGQLAGGPPLGAVGNVSLRAAFLVSATLLMPNLWLLRERRQALTEEVVPPAREPEPSPE
ncbi:MAG: MFS transporter [Chloroflexaceae bacterium]|nr:MFS transporter [Chloroflexaceae bacterium]